MHAVSGLGETGGFVIRQRPSENRIAQLSDGLLCGGCGQPLVKQKPRASPWDDTPYLIGRKSRRSDTCIRHPVRWDDSAGTRRIQESDLQLWRVWHGTGWGRLKARLRRSRKRVLLFRRPPAAPAVRAGRCGGFRCGGRRRRGFRGRRRRRSVRGRG